MKTKKYEALMETILIFFLLSSFSHSANDVVRISCSGIVLASEAGPKKWLESRHASKKLPVQKHVILFNLKKFQKHNCVS